MWSAALTPLVRSAPWLTLLKTAFPDCLAAWGRADWRETFTQYATRQARVSGGGQTLRFGPPEALPTGMAYEQFIFTSGVVPSRDNPHDFFNALMWLAFGQTKALVNRLQAKQITALGVGATRGGLRDFLTLFDENALLLLADEHAIKALRQHDWQTLLVRRRGDWLGEAPTLAAIPFGHALLEKLLTPYKAITAHVWPIGEGETCFKIEREKRTSKKLDRNIHAAFRAKASGKAHEYYGQAFLNTPVNLQALDQHLAAQLQAITASLLTPRGLLLPLPVLGIPTWCEANIQPEFYEDTQVFRPARRVKSVLKPITDPD